MQPIKSNRASATDGAATNVAVHSIIAIIDELSLVVEEENRILARGIPASLSTSAARKNELADAFEAWVKQVAEGRLCVGVTDEALRRHLMDRVKILRVAMAENVTRLRAAIDASRRRIDAVMRAIRAEVTKSSPYGRNGRLQESRTPHSVRGNGISA